MTGFMYSGVVAANGGCIGIGLGGAGCSSRPRGFSSLTSSSESFSSSSVPSSTTTSGARTRPFCLVIDSQRLYSQCQRDSNTRIKNIRRSTVSVLDFGRIPFSDAATDGLRDDGFDMRLVLGWEGTEADTELCSVGSLGWISDGDEYDRCRDGVEESPKDRGKRGFVDHVWTLFKPAISPLSASGRRGTVSAAGVEGGVRADARTSNWRERYVREFMCRAYTAASTLWAALDGGRGASRWKRRRKVMMGNIRHTWRTRDSDVA